MKKILIFGAGSIGNHMAFACRKLGYDVCVIDKDQMALNRMKKKIYPKRYGKWDNNIRTFKFNKILSYNLTYDLVIIGTPPSTHLNIYNYCKKRISFNKILIEKPLFHIMEKKLDSFKRDLNKKLIFCGYNHSISPSFKYFENNILKRIKFINKIEVKWCEAWDGILKAHFWLKDESKSYLGNYKHGGGALQEHSHGLHLLFLVLKKNKINLSNIKLRKNIFFNKNKKYDLISSISGYDKKKYFSYKTDLITFPAEKKITIYGKNSKIIWVCNYKQNVDLVRIYKNNIINYEKFFKKTRSSEFENEVKQIMKIKNIKERNELNLNPNYAFETIKIIKKVFKNDK